MDLNNLQDEYKPKALREEPVRRIRRERAFAIGVFDHNNGYGMIYGPFPGIEGCLEWVPDCGDKEIHIIHFTQWDGIDIPLYRWNSDRQVWQRLPIPTETELVPVEDPKIDVVCRVCGENPLADRSGKLPQVVHIEKGLPVARCPHCNAEFVGWVAD